MTDRLHDDGDEGRLPAWAVAALRAPVDSDPGRTAPGKARVMALVRRAPRHHHGLRATRPRWARRGTLAPVCGVVLVGMLSLAAGLTRYGGSAGGSAMGDASSGARATATVLGDTVVARLAIGGRVLRDTVLDTLWIVRFVFRDPEAGHVTLVGDFNGWSRTATPLARTAASRGMTARGHATGAWAATVLVPRDAVQYAFVVDGRRLGGRAVIAPPPRSLHPAAGTSDDST